MTAMDTILVVNGGSSSVKFQVFAVDGNGGLRRQVKGQMDGIGSRPRLRATGAAGDALADRCYPIDAVPDVPAALMLAGTWLRDEHQLSPLAVGHRVVHGGPDYDRPVLIDHGVVARLERLTTLAPLHQPHNLAPIRTLLAKFPALPQVACFDTAFHRDHDEVADHYAIPRRLHEEGVRRYGFHGLSYEYIAKTLPDVALVIAKARVIVAHLGSGASMCAIHGGRSVESTMGFTALDGLPMGTRTGQIDPGVVLYLMTAKGMSATAVQDFLYRDCGLKGLSGLHTVHPVEWEAAADIAPPDGQASYGLIVPEPDLQLVPWASQRDDGTCVPSLLAFLMKPRSTGTLTLQSDKPFAPPLIAHAHLGDDRDVEPIVRAIEHARRVAATEPVVSLVARETVPGDIDVERYVRENVRGYYHPVGTCAIGSVVGGQLGVLGVENLYITDASVMPTAPRANTHLTALAIAERAAAWI